MLVNDIGVFSMYASKNTYYKTFERNVTSVLATNTYYHWPLVGTVLHYVEGNLYNQKVFCNGCNRALGFSLRLKERKGKDRTKSPKFLGTRDFVLINNKSSLYHSKNYNPKMKAVLIPCWPHPIFLPSFPKISQIVHYYKLNSPTLSLYSHPKITT